MASTHPCAQYHVLPAYPSISHVLYIYFWSSICYKIIKVIVYLGIRKPSCSYYFTFLLCFIQNYI